MMSIKRAILASVIAVCLLVLGTTCQAAEAMPWWHVSTISAPASKPSGESKMFVEVSNLGDTMINGSAQPVTTVDKLPAGVTAAKPMP